VRAADGEVTAGRFLQLATWSGSKSRSTRVLAVSAAWSVVEYTILSAACQIRRAKSSETVSRRGAVGDVPVGY
jgi:hypothetical protein